MHALHWLLGCGLCIASASAMATSNTDAQCADGDTPTASEPATSHSEGGSSSADLLGLGRTASHAAGTGSATSTPASSDHTGGGTPQGHAPHVGWQSLLPGSIQ